MLEFIILTISILLFTELFKWLFGKNRATNDMIVQVLAWVVGSIEILICLLLDVSTFEEMNIFKALMVGFLASLCANGVADTKIIQTFLSFFQKKN